MNPYLALVRHVLAEGTRKENRTGVDTKSTFNYNYEIDLRRGFPLLTTKAVSWKNIVVELLWFLSGQTDIAILKRHGCKFWDAWADPETGRVPSAYGSFWRQFPVHARAETPKFCPDCGGRMDMAGRPPAHIPKCDYLKRSTHDVGGFNDQIRWVLDEMKRNPMSRRMVVSAWAPGNAQLSKLPPCHCLFAFNVQNDPPPEYVHYGHNYGHDPACNTAPGTEGYGLLPHGEGMRQGLRWCPECAKLISYLKDPPPKDDPKSLCLHLTQRSADVFLGVPYNIASYALLLHLFSRFTGIAPGIFAHTLIDAHIYTSKPDGSQAEYDHVPALREQLSRSPRSLPRLIIDDRIKGLDDIERLLEPAVTTEEVMSYFILDGYDPHPALHGRVAV